jgi:thymidylate synthase
LQPGPLQWIWGDAHVYNETSHINAAMEIMAKSSIIVQDNAPEMIYTPTSIEFLAADFTIVSEIPSPLVTIKPRLL